MKDTAKPKASDASDRISEAVIEVVAQCGVSRLTHRRVAAAGKLSLSATTYHFRTKGEMLAHASQVLLSSYAERLGEIARACNDGARKPSTISALSLQILRNAAGKNRTSALAWCEIMLDAAKSADGHATALDWYDQLEDVWTQVAKAFGDDTDDTRLNSMIDITVGLLFISRALALDAEQISAVDNGATPSAIWGLDASEKPAQQQRSKPLTTKAKATRARILKAAIELLVEGGPGAVGYSAVAQRSGESMTAPAYHFGSISGLLRQAETKMFSDSKDRYRKVLSGSQSDIHSAEALADVTAAIFIREATQFSAQSIAHYSIWLEAARDDELRSDVASAIADQAAAWTRRLSNLFDCSEHNAITCQALFVGALVRALATGAPTETLAGLRNQFLWLFTQLASGRDSSTLFQNLLTTDA